MATSTSTASRKCVVGKGDSDGLRKVEKDVLITKKVKEKAMKLCASAVQGMTDL